MIPFLRASLSFAWLPFKAMRYYPVSGILEVVRAYVNVGIWFFVSLFLREYATIDLAEYGGDFVAYMVVGVLFFGNASTILSLPFQSISTAYWDRRLELYHGQSYGVWAYIVGRFIWAMAYHTIILVAIVATVLVATDIELSAGIHPGLAIAFYLLFMLTCFGLGLAGSGNFVFLEVKQGSEPFAWTVNVLARLFSGVYYPLAVLPAFLRPISAIVPHTHALRGIRLVMIAGEGLGDTTTRSCLVVLLAFCVASLAAGVYLLNKALRRAEATTGLGLST